MIGELVAHRETEAIRLAIVADDIQAGHLRLFAGVFGERRQRERLPRTHDNAAVALVEPLRLHTGLPRRRFATLHAPFENAHGVGHRRFIAGLLVHLVARRSAARVRQTSTADQHVCRVRVVQWRQDAQVFKQLRVVVAGAEAEALHLLLKRAAGLDCGQGQITDTAGVLDFADLTVVDHADTALAVG